MTPSGRKQKGKTYENKIAADIHNFLLAKNEAYRNLYETLGNENLKPRRDASSGTFIGSLGDIDLGLAKKFFPFAIECKHWKILDLSLNSILSDKIKSLVTVWMDQALPKGRETGLLPLIVFKANRTEDFCFYDKNEVKLITINRFIKIDNWVMCLFSDFMVEVDIRIEAGERPFKGWKDSFFLKKE